MVIRLTLLAYEAIYANSIAITEVIAKTMKQTLFVYVLAMTFVNIPPDKVLFIFKGVYLLFTIPLLSNMVAREIVLKEDINYFDALLLLEYEKQYRGMLRAPEKTFKAFFHGS